MNNCSMCDMPVLSRGLCRKHYWSKWRENNKDKIGQYNSKYYYKNYREKRDSANLVQRQFRKDNPEKARANDIKAHTKHREKRKTNSMVSFAIESGKLKKSRECSICGGVGEIQGHHDDYEKPLEVRWVCIPCHEAIHHKQEMRDRIKQL